MAHCYSIGVTIDGREQTICTTHVPGNERLRQDIEAGKTRALAPDEVSRAVEYFKKTRANGGLRHRLDESPP